LCFNDINPENAVRLSKSVCVIKALPAEDNGGRLSAMGRSKDGFSLIAAALFSKPFNEKLLIKKSNH
jgi:hypothetical protein